MAAKKRTPSKRTPTSQSKQPSSASSYALMTLTRPKYTDPFPPSEPWSGTVVSQWQNKTKLSAHLVELKASLKKGTFWDVKDEEYSVVGKGAWMRSLKVVVGRDEVDGKEGKEVGWRLFWVEKRGRE